MAVHDSGEAAARLSESFQQTDDKDTRGRRVFGRVKNISYFRSRSYFTISTNGPMQARSANGKTAPGCTDRPMSFLPPI